MRSLLGLILVFVSLALLQNAQAQTKKPVTDVFDERVQTFRLDQQSISDGVAILTQTTHAAYSIEFELASKISDPAPPLAKVSAEVGPGTVSQVLGELCRLDPTFAWKRVGNTANIFPKRLENDPEYLLNRVVPTLSFSNVTDAEKAVFETVSQLPGPREQIAVLQSGGSVSFSQPYSATFKNITVREAFDRIAMQLGIGYGWQFGGARNFRVITFHNRLGVRGRENRDTK